MFRTKKALGIIRENLPVRGDKEEEKTTIFFDSAASRSLIRSDIARELSTPRELLVPREFAVANGGKIDCRYLCELIVEIEGKRMGIEAFPVDNLPVPLILGALDMEAYMIKLDLAKRRLDLSEFT